MMRMITRRIGHVGGCGDPSLSFIAGSQGAPNAEYSRLTQSSQGAGLHADLPALASRH
jgi:hypothetical protein